MVTDLKRSMKPKTTAWIIGIAIGAACLFEAVRAFGQLAIRDTFGVRRDANTEPDLAGYRVRAGTNSGWPLWVKDVGLTTQATIGISNHPQLFVTVTAYNTAGLESDPSNEIRIGGRPGQVHGLQGSLSITTTVVVTNVIFFP